MYKPQEHEAVSADGKAVGTVINERVDRDLEDLENAINTTQQTTTTFCPECREESFEVVITDSGKGFDPEYGTVYWYNGDGKCAECEFEAPYSDSSV